MRITPRLRVTACLSLLGLAIDLGMSRLNNYMLRWHRGLEN